MPLVRCSVCQQQFDPERSTALPFCSDRCRLIDLGRWLDERYSLPSEKAADVDLEKQFPDEQAQ